MVIFSAAGSDDLSDVELDVLIPLSAGLGLTKRYYQRRTMFQYAALYVFGLRAFQNLEMPAI